MNMFNFLYSLFMHGLTFILISAKGGKQMQNGTERKRYLSPTKTLNLPINSDVEGGVCACMCEARSDQWRFPLLSSAQQQMGRGCGLVG